MPHTYVKMTVKGTVQRKGKEVTRVLMTMNHCEMISVHGQCAVQLPEISNCLAFVRVIKQ